MLLIKKEVIERIRSATQPETIQEMLTNAFTLELATLPTYLTGIFSVMPGANTEAVSLVQSVAYEEMLHMTLACNLLIAVGGQPGILAAGKSLHYPTQLPNSVDESLTVTLGALTPTQVQTVYMGIEHPDTTAVLPGETAVQPSVQLKADQGYASIGDFYTAIMDALEANPTWINSQTANLQVDISQYFPPCGAGTGIVTDVASSNAAITTIIAQGEGAQLSEDPINPSGGLDGGYAHYFKFGEIFYGKALVPDSGAPSGWSYTGASVPLDSNGVYNLLPNAALSDYVPGSGAFITGEEFYNTYIRLLTALNNVFNGAPEAMGAAIGIMFELKLVAQKVVQWPATPTNPDGPVAAPPFQLIRAL